MCSVSDESKPDCPEDAAAGLRPRSETLRSRDFVQQDFAVPCMGVRQLHCDLQRAAARNRAALRNEVSDLCQRAMSKILHPKSILLYCTIQAVM